MREELVNRHMRVVFMRADIVLLVMPTRQGICGYGSRRKRPKTAAHVPEHRVIAPIPGLGQAEPLTLLVVLVQFTALIHSNWTRISARAIGGAFGSAVLDAITNNYVAGHCQESQGTARNAYPLIERETLTIACS